MPAELVHKPLGYRLQWPTCVGYTYWWLTCNAPLCVAYTVCKPHCVWLFVLEMPIHVVYRPWKSSKKCEFFPIFPNFSQFFPIFLEKSAIFFEKVAFFLKKLKKSWKKVEKKFKKFEKNLIFLNFFQFFLIFRKSLIFIKNWIFLKISKNINFFNFSQTTASHVLRTGLRPYYVLGGLSTGTLMAYGLRP